MNAGETDEGDADNENDLEPGEDGLHVGGFARADDVERGDEPDGDGGRELGPVEMRVGGLRKKGERGGTAEHAHEAGGDGGDGCGLGNRDPGPGVEERGEVAVGFADEGVLAADA